MQHTSKPYKAWFYLWNGKVSVIPLSSTNGDMLIATSRLPSTHSSDGGVQSIKHFEGLRLKQKHSQSDSISLQCSFCELRTKPNVQTNKQTQTTNHTKPQLTISNVFSRICISD